MLIVSRLVSTSGITSDVIPELDTSITDISVNSERLGMSVNSVQFIQRKPAKFVSPDIVGVTANIEQSFIATCMIDEKFVNPSIPIISGLLMAADIKFPPDNDTVLPITETSVNGVPFAGSLNQVFHLLTSASSVTGH